MSILESRALYFGGNNLANAHVRFCFSDKTPNCFVYSDASALLITSVVHYSNNSISDRLLKSHGHWKTDAQIYMYVEEDICKRLQTTTGNFLGL